MSQIAMSKALRGNHGFVAFIDESGSEGRHETNGACEFIVVSAVVVRVENLQYVTEIYQKARQYCRKSPAWNFPKFAKHNSDEQKHLISCLIAASPIRTAVITAHKPSLTNNNMHDKHGKLYYFLSQLLIERISWICRDACSTFKSGDGTPKIIFSERKSLRYQDFIEYAKMLRDDKGKHPSNTDWRHIDLSKVVEVEQENCDGLRLADFIASAYGRAIEYKGYGHTDDRFVRPLKANIYRSNGKAFKNGFKLFPREAEALIESDDRFAWFKMFYRK